MKTWVVVVFGTIEQITQTGVEQEETRARIDCRIIYKGEMFTTTLNVKQGARQPLGDPDTIEVEKPPQYNGPLNWSACSLAATAHYKRAVSNRASVIAVAPAAATVAMANNTIEVKPSSIVMECEDVAADLATNGRGPRHVSVRTARRP